MRVLVCGGRDYKTIMRGADIVCDTLFYHPKSPEKHEVEFITGCASGADQIPIYLTNNGTNDEWGKLHKYPADWKQFGKSAGYIRNFQMLREGKPDLVIVFPGGKGTKHMTTIAEAEEVEVIYVEG